MALTHKQAIDWIFNSIGKAYNPDGVYGYQCLTEDSMILNDDYSYTSIKKMKVGDKVVSQYSEKNEILKFKPISSQVYRVKTEISTFTSSYDHIFRMQDGGYTETKEIKIGDEIALFKATKTQPCGLLENELIFLGFWLNNGNKMSSPEEINSIDIIVNVETEEESKYLESLGLGLEIKSIKGSFRQYYLLFEKHAKLANFIRRLNGKRISLLWTADESKAILKGFLLAKSHGVYKTKGEFTVGNELAYTLQQLAINCGIKMVVTPSLHDMSIVKYDLNAKPSGKVVVIEKLDEEQTVYALELSGDKTYIANSHIHHNCKDYIDAYCIALFGNWANTVRPGNAKDVFNNANSDFFYKISSNSGSIPQTGDIIVYNSWNTNPYGHIAVVIDANNSGAMVVEQDGFQQTPARKVFYSYQSLPVIGWLRPKYAQQEPIPQDNTWREVTAVIGVRVRNEPTTESGIFATYRKGSTIQMKGYCKGENVNGSDIWYVSARSTKFLHISAFDEGVKDLPHLAEFDRKVVENKTEKQQKPVESPPEYKTFDKQFDFVDEVQPAAVCNQFYGRKNLKGSDGKYFADIPKDYASQKAFVDQLNSRETTPIREITVHNTANTSLDSTLNEFRKKDNFKSAHLVVSNSKVVQCVPKENTAFTNGSHESNIESFTIEFLDDVTDKRYIDILKKVTNALGVDKIGKHRDHSNTLCPAKLTDKHFNKIKEEVLNKEAEKPRIEELKVEKPQPEVKEINKNQPKPIPQTLTEKEMAQIEELKNQANTISDSVEYNPIIPESIKLKTYFITGSLLITTTLVAAIAVAIAPQHAILILAIAGALNTAYGGINQLFKISSRR